MELFKPSIKKKFLLAFNTFVASTESIKAYLTDDELQKVSDAIAIGQTIKDRLETTSDEELKPSIVRFSNHVTAAFQTDFFSLEKREKHKKSQMDRVEDLGGGRTLGSGKELLSTYPDVSNNVDIKYTASAIDPSRIAERILRDIQHHLYPSVQDAFEGYANDNPQNSVWPYASANQKCTLGKILVAWGFNVNYDKWEKQANKEIQKYKEAYDDWGKGEPKKEDRLITRSADVKVADDQFGRNPVPTSDVTRVWCAKCGKSTDHSKNPLKCKECQTLKTKKSILEKFVEAQYDPYDNLGEAYNKDQINVPQEMVKTGLGYACGGCGYSEMMEKEGAYNCPKCGGMMAYGGDMSQGGAGDHGNKLPTNIPNPPNDPNPATNNNTMKDGITPYTALLRQAANKNLMLSYECVKEMGIGYADTMKRLGMKSARAKYLIRWLELQNEESK